MTAVLITAAIMIIQVFQALTMDKTVIAAMDRMAITVRTDRVTVAHCSIKTYNNVM